MEDGALADLLMQCCSLPQQATGRLGIRCADDPNAVTALQAWRPGERQP